MLKSNVVVFVIALGMFALIHLLLLHTYFYWRYPDVDIPMHFLGGTMIALGIFAARDLRIPFFSSLTRFVPTSLFVVCVAIAWELFEYFGGISLVTHPGFVSDTALDLVLGLAGGMVGYFVAGNIAELDHDNA